MRQFLLLTGSGDTWNSIGPFTGAVNTISFMLVGTVTLFFNQSWRINEKVLSAKQKHEETSAKLLELNQTLEHKVVERTEMLTSSEHKARRILNTPWIPLWSRTLFHHCRDQPGRRGTDRV